MKTNISKSDIDKLFKRYEKGELIRDLAKEFGLKPNTLTCIFKRSGLEKKFKGQYADLPYNEIYRLHVEDNISYYTLSKRYKVSHSTLLYNLERRAYTTDSERRKQLPLEEIFQRHINGELIIKLALEYKITTKALSERFRKAGLKKHRLIHNYPFEAIEKLRLELGSLKKVSDKYGLNYNSIQNRYYKRDLSTKGYKIINHRFFEKIDIQAAAYFLGFIFADGYNCEQGNFFRIKINVRDKYILEKLASLLTEGQKGIPIWEEGKGKICALSLSGKSFCQDLSKWGAGQAKTFNIEFPKNLPHDMVKHFIRGYFDGDGSIHKTSKKGKRHRGTITSGSRLMLLGLQDYLNTQGIYSNVYPKDPTKSKKNCHAIYIQRKNELLKFRSLLYDDAESNLYLIRKYKRFQALD